MSDTKTMAELKIKTRWLNKSDAQAMLACTFLIWPTGGNWIGKWKKRKIMEKSILSFWRISRKVITLKCYNGRKEHTHTHLFYFCAGILRRFTRWNIQCNAHIIVLWNKRKEGKQHIKTLSAAIVVGVVVSTRNKN